MNLWAKGLANFYGALGEGKRQRGGGKHTERTSSASLPGHLPGLPCLAPSASPLLPRTSPAPHAAAATQLGVEAKTGEERGEEHRPEDLALGCPRLLPGLQADLALGCPRPLPGLRAEGPGASHSGRRTWTGRTCACSGRRSSRPGRTTSA